MLTPFEEDATASPSRRGTKVRLEVFAERLGSPLDAALVVRNDKGDQLARAEDSPGTLDPVLEYTVPDKVTSIIVGVVDAQGRGGPRGVYRLVDRPARPPAEATSSSDHAAAAIVAAGRRPRRLPVLVERRGYQGKIDLTADELPAGVKLEGDDDPRRTPTARWSRVERGDAPCERGHHDWHGRGDDGDERAGRRQGPSAGTPAAVAGDRDRRRPDDREGDRLRDRLARACRPTPALVPGASWRCRSR